MIATSEARALLNPAVGASLRQLNNHQLQQVIKVQIWVKKTVHDSFLKLLSPIPLFKPEKLSNTFEALLPFIRHIISLGVKLGGTESNKCT